MKKSKIIGLSLGFTTLAAVAVTTPFIVSSCSKTDSDLLIIDKNLRSIFQESKGSLTPDFVNSTPIKADDIKTGPNTATIYLSDSKYLSFILNTSPSLFEIIGEPEGYDRAASINWTPVDNENYKLANDNGIFTFTTKKDLSTFNKNQVMTVNLEGTLDYTKLPVDQQQTEEKITKKISIKLNIIRGSWNSNDGYVKPNQK